jgi:hypothetical protein
MDPKESRVARLSKLFLGHGDNFVKVTTKTEPRVRILTRWMFEIVDGSDVLVCLRKKSTEADPKACL